MAESLRDTMLGLAADIRNANLEAVGMLLDQASDLEDAKQRLRAYQNHMNSETQEAA
jgi:hypothetical protein